jgi:hypothetical protein
MGPLPPPLARAENARTLSLIFGFPVIVNLRTSNRAVSSWYDWRRGLIASPFIFGYADAGTLRYWHFILGIAVVLLAALELRQDWKLSDAELGHHSGR